MALIVCPDCTRQVSPKARFCVHCGRPRPACKGGWLRKVVGVVLILAMAGGGYAFTSNWNNNKTFRADTMNQLHKVLVEVQELKAKFTGSASKAEKLADPEKRSD